MANQYTKAHEAGITPDDPAWPKQAESRREHPEEVRQAIRASVAARFLQDLIEDQEADTSHRVSAAKILLDKTLASLSSIDQTVRDDSADSPEALEAKLKHFVSKADPALLSKILGERAREIMAEVGKQPDPAQDQEGNKAA